ncbi:MAG: histidine phosphatase family protein [Chloroflexi bacterium]|nr:histidine phosphatase family protein [Chloroflexota bacterium]
MITRLVLIRHAETEHNAEYRICGWTDSLLSTRGRDQAHRLGLHLAGRERLQRVYTSPLVRALETARQVARHHALEPQPVDDLREMHFGEIEGLTVAEFQTRYPDSHARAQVEDDLSFAWPGGESRRAFYDRVVLAGRRLAADNAGRTVAAVSHGGFISVFLATALTAAPWKWRDFYVMNGSVSVLRFDDGRVVAERINDTEYLSAAMAPKE